MTKRNKIEKYGLDKMALRMYHDEDATYTKIRDAVNQQLGETDSVSIMSVKRLIEAHDVKEVEDKVKRGEDPALEVYNEFKTNMSDLQLEVQNRITDIDEMVQDAKAERDVKKLIRLLSLQKNYFEQVRKNLESLIKYSEDRFKPVVNVSMRKDVKIKNLLIDFSNIALCPKCKKKVLNFFELQE